MKLQASILASVLAICLQVNLFAQETKKLYNPEADAKTDIANAIVTAKKRS